MLTPLVRIKTKYQVTLPPLIREELGVDVGDLLEARIEKQQIILSPRSIIDREIALGLEDIKHGRGIGPFATAKEAIRALHREIKKYKAKK